MSIYTFKNLSVRLVAMLIALIMIIGLLPVTALADESSLPFTLKYKVSEDGEELTAHAEVMGTVQEPTGGGTGTAYVVSLPYGAEVTSYTHNSAYRTTYGSTLTSPSGSLDQIAGSYVGKRGDGVSDRGDFSILQHNAWLYHRGGRHDMAGTRERKGILHLFHLLWTESRCGGNRADQHRGSCCR